MKTTIIYDNTVHKTGLQADWGFAALVEAKGQAILFDTGTNGSILLSNMEKLGISPKDIEAVFISHAHYDHTGGLNAFLDQNKHITAWIPHSYTGVKNAKEVITIRKSQELYRGIYTTGELEGVEQSLCVKTGKGIVIIAGCSHPRLEHILQAASEFGKVYGIIGGLHGNRPESLKGIRLICATHCTQYQKEIKSMYQHEYIEGGAGRVIEIE